MKTHANGKRDLMRRVGCWACFGSVSSLLLVGVYYAGFRIVTTASVPVGVYQLTNGPIAKGKLVALCLPDEIANFGKERGYLHNGTCANGSQPVVKMIGAIVKDTVQITQNSVTVNGRAFANSHMQERDSKGRALPHVMFGEQKTHEHDVWVFSFYATNSWDSRHYGPVSESSILGTMTPVWTWEGGGHEQSR